MKAHILVIDDDEVACDFCRKLYRLRAMKVKAYTSAREALKQDLSRYDLLMSDISHAWNGWFAVPWASAQKMAEFAGYSYDCLWFSGNNNGGNKSGRLGLYQQTFFTGRLQGYCKKSVGSSGTAWTAHEIGNGNNWRSEIDWFVSDDGWILQTKLPVSPMRRPVF